MGKMLQAAVKFYDMKYCHSSGMMRSSCVPQSSAGFIDRPAKNFLHLLGAVLVYCF